MKIGIVTQPLLGNYGGILQNYALQQVLRQLGHDPITLDFQGGYSGINIFIQELKIFSRFLRGKSKKWAISPFKRHRNNPSIIRFVNDHIATTQPFWDKYSNNLIQQHGIEFIIVGSDQVWRPKYVLNIYDMYLQWIQDDSLKRIAYAASFGTSDWEYSQEQANICSKLLKKFNGVSVRECSGVDLVNQLGASATQVLDPTLLLGKQGFDTLFESEPTKTNTLGTYVLDSNPALNGIIEQVMESVHLQDCVSLKVNTQNIGPTEWIQSIRESSFFVTDSFHGTVFCLLYHVPFITYLNSARGADRFYTLLEPLKLANRVVTEFNIDTIKHIAESSIDWSQVDETLAVLRTKSYDFLTTSLT